MEGVLSEGVLSGNGLCLEIVMYGGGFVRGGFVRRGFCPCTSCNNSTNCVTCELNKSRQNINEITT